MSRIGKKPIPVPDKVKVEISGDLVTVSSADGKKKLTQSVSHVTVKVEDSQVIVETADQSRLSRSAHGLYRTLISNMIAGVTTGWTRVLSIEGAGFKAEMTGRKLMLTVGYTYPREYNIPAGVDVELPKANQIVVKGIDKQLVGAIAASIRAVRPPDPYRGKGIRYEGERAVRKVAKGK